MSKYNIEENTNKLISTCFEENPTLTIREISNLLGISERSLHRILHAKKVVRERRMPKSVSNWIEKYSSN